MSNDHRWPPHRGNGITFHRPQREPIRWDVVAAVLCIVAAGLALLGAGLALPLLSKGIL